MIFRAVALRLHACGGGIRSAPRAESVVVAAGLDRRREPAVRSRIRSLSMSILSGALTLLAFATSAGAADEPSTRDTALAVGGGVLVIVLAALGLTIPFRSLGADLRGRKRRYRRRTRREPRGT